MAFYLRREHALPYDNYLTAERELRDGRVELTAGPGHVRVDVTSRCNLRCVQCLFTASRATGQDMDANVLERVETEILPRAATMQFADEGEPLLFRDFDRLVATLSRLRPPFSRIFTNGTSIGERAARQIVESGLVTLAVSLDGASEEVFGQVRRTRLQPIVANLERLRDIKRELGLQNPAVTIHVVVMEANVAELADLVRLADRVRAAEVVFDRLLEYTPEMNDQSTQAAREEEVEVDDRAGEAPDRIAVEGTPVERGRCQHPWKFVTVKADGRVYPCRFLTVPMGNLKEQPFLEIWNSARYRALRSSILDDSYSFCRGARCSFAGAPEDMFRARVELLGDAPAAAPNQAVCLKLAIANTGTARWNAAPTPSDPTHFVLTSMVYDDQRRLLAYEPQTTYLPCDVAAGERVEVEVHLAAPKSPGQYVVGFEMNRAHVFRFTTLGSAPCEVPLRVDRHAAAVSV